MKDLKIDWAEAPIKTLWGSGMMQGLIEINKDETASIYVHKDAIAEFEQALGKYFSKNEPDECKDLKLECKVIDRKFLQELRDLSLAMVPNNLNLDFAKAYMDLGLALDRLDAMHARLLFDNQDSLKSVVDNVEART